MIDYKSAILDEHQACEKCSTAVRKYFMKRYTVYFSWINKAWYCIYCNHYKWELKR